MKKILVLLLGIFIIGISFTKAQVIEYLGVKGPLKFANEKFEFVWSSNPNENYYIQEYLPKGETLESFNQMLTVSIIITDIGMADAINYKVNELEERKKTDKICNYSVVESPDGKEMIIDFLVGEITDSIYNSVVEFNVYKYKQIDVSKNKKAILLYFYSKRSYADKVISFLDTMKEERIKYLNEMISTKTPKITINK